MLFYLHFFRCFQLVLRWCSYSVFVHIYLTVLYHFFLLPLSKNHCFWDRKWKLTMAALSSYCLKVHHLVQWIHCHLWCFLRQIKSHIKSFLYIQRCILETERRMGFHRGCYFSVYFNHRWDFFQTEIHGGGCSLFDLGFFMFLFHCLVKKITIFLKGSFHRWS